MRLWNFLQEHMMLNPKQTVCENNAKLSFEDLVIWCESFSKQLNGIKCCAVLCKSELAGAMVILGCIAAGVTALPLSWHYGELHCKKIIETISPDAIVTDEGGELQICTIFDSEYEEPDIHPALIMCTSGTTGKPKGVMLSEQNIISNLTDISRYFEIGKTDVLLISRPLYHCAVLNGELFCSLIKGTKIIFLSGRVDITRIISTIKNCHITAFCGTPTLIGLLSNFKNRIHPNELKHICISGECMDKKVGRQILEAFQTAKIYHIYGLTEASPRVAYLPPDKFSKHSDYVGQPLDSVEIKLVDSSGNTPKPGKEGEIWVKGPNIMIGYYKDKKKTAEVLKKGWLRTGDIGVMSKSGMLKVKGRKDDMIIRSGMNIYPTEIESAIKSDSRVSGVFVYGKKTDYGTQIHMRISGNFSTVNEVKKMCMDLLPKYQVPAHIDIVDKLETNSFGKVLRKEKND